MFKKHVLVKMFNLYTEYKICDGISWRNCVNLYKQQRWHWIK